MNPFREMVLISMSEYKQIKDANIPQSTNPNMYKELKDITNRYGEDIPADKRLKLEGEIINRFTEPNKPMSSQKAEIKHIDNDEYIRNHLESFGPVNKKRAKQLYQHLKSFSPRWNDKGQIYSYIDNQPIPLSSIVELIDFVTNTRRIDRVPAGFNDFVLLLDETNVPRNLFSNSGLLRIEKYKQTSDATLEFDDDENYKSFTTSTPDRKVWTTLK